MVIALQLLLIILKLSGTVAWSWWLILLPVWGAVGLAVVFFILFLLGALTQAWVDS